MGGQPSRRADAALRPRKTIRGKLIGMLVASVGSALVLSGAIAIWREADGYLRAKRETLVATAQVFAAAASDATANGNAALAARSLRAVTRVPGLVRAEVFDRDGKLLSGVGSGARLTRDIALDGDSSALTLLQAGTVSLSVPVVEGGEQAGRLRLVSDTSDFAGRLWTVLAEALGLALLALGLGLVLALRLQRAITRPLATLANAMVEVGPGQDHVPVEGPIGDDETGHLTRRFNAMIGEINRSTQEILARESEIIDRLSRAGEMRDDVTGQHVVRVAAVSRIIAEGLDLQNAYVEDLCRASPLHDVGKIAISDAVLRKPGRLDAAERREIERHAEFGHQILSGSRSPLVRLAAEIALTHHERWDGKGYPRGLAGEAIPLSGRVTAVADVTDALLSERPYKAAWSLAGVEAHLRAEAGTHFDPDCVAALLERWPRVEAIYGQRAQAQAA